MKNFKSIAKFVGRFLLILLGIAVLALVLLVVVLLRLDETSGRLESSGQDRKYLLYVPESYDPATPIPLVISIHGFAEWPAHQRDISQWNELAEQFGFMVVYPSGTGFPRRWLSSSQADDPMQDVRFIADLIDFLQQTYNIDESRIYANGLSNGGGMATWLACQLSERIAAVGSVSGAFLFSPHDCNFSRPVPLIAFHGTADPIVPYVGGSSSSFDLPFPVVSDWVKAWAQQNGCYLTPLELTTLGEVSGIRYTQCEANAEVAFYTILGGGHSWPGGQPLPKWIVGQTTQAIDATELMWLFFAQYSLNR